MASGGNSSCRIKKIFRLKNGDLAGFAGEVGLATQFMNWLNSDRKIEEFPESQRDNNDAIQCMLIKKDGTIWIFERSPHPYQVFSDKCTIGSGADYAAAVLELGYDAVTAVRIANKLCPSCGHGCDKLALK